MKRIARFACVLGLQLLALGGYGQCPRNASDLYEVEQLYLKGRFADIRNRNGCVDDLFDLTRPQAQPSSELLTVAERFMHLYALSCLALEDQLGAKEAVCSLMQRFPAHVQDPDMDPPVFMEMQRSIIPYPRLGLGFSMGLNMSLPQMRDRQSLLVDSSSTSGTNFFPRVLPQANAEAGIELQLRLAYRHGLTLGVGMGIYSMTMRYNSREFKDEEAVVGDWRIRQWEQQGYLQLPLSYMYRHPLGPRINGQQQWLSLQLGSTLRLRVRSRGVIEATRWEAAQGSGEADPSVISLNLTDPSPGSNLVGGAVQFDVGFEQERKRSYWFMRLGGRFGLQSMHIVGSQENVLLNEFWDFQIPDQDLYLHNLHLTLGIGLPRNYGIYHHAPKKRAD